MKAFLVKALICWQTAPNENKSWIVIADNEEDAAKGAKDSYEEMNNGKFMLDSVNDLSFLSDSFSSVIIVDPEGLHLRARSSVG